jgi:hypothetical protein
MSKQEDNIKMGLRIAVCEGMDCIHLPQDTVPYRDFMNTVMELNL